MQSSHGMISSRVLSSPQRAISVQHRRGHVTGLTVTRNSIAIAMVAADGPKKR